MTTTTLDGIMIQAATIGSDQIKDDAVTDGKIKSGDA